MSKGITGAIALALALLPLLTPLPVFANPTCAATTTDFGGVFVSPTGPIGTWSMSGFTLTSQSQLGQLFQGTLTATFTSTLGVGGGVIGMWSFNTATPKLLMKVQGSTYSIDFAYLNLPLAGFTFQGVLHIVGQMPVPMRQTSSSSAPISCA